MYIYSMKKIISSFAYIMIMIGAFAQAPGEKCATMTQFNQRVLNNPEVQTRMGQTEALTKQWLENHPNVYVIPACRNTDLLTEEAFVTLVTECESIVNNRPLIATTDDASDYRVLTPADVLVVKPAPGLPPCVDSGTNVRKQWRQVQSLADSFWRRYRADYLPTLQRRQKWLNPQRNFAVDDLVILHDDQSPRNVWPFARITKVYTSNDSKVRSVQVKTSNGHYFDRPITKIYLMEAAN